MRAPGSLERLLAAALAAGALACGGGGGGDNSATGPQPQPASNTVQATPQLAFTPSSVTVTRGSAVTWAFGSVAHTVVFDTGVTTTPPSGGNPYPTGNRVPRITTALGPAGAPADIDSTADASVSRTFDATGTFHYHCRIHPQMTGQVTVQ